MSSPPFRADHVGSYLRPERLRAARERFAAGHLPAQELHAIEDECIRDVVHAQENVGLKGITDGEFRRTFFHVDFLERLRRGRGPLRRVRVAFQERATARRSVSRRRPCMSTAR